MEGMNKGRQYEAAVRTAIEPLIHSPECQKSPYMMQKEGGWTCLIVIAGDRGLAGGYNANIFRALREYPDAHIIPIGKRACDRFHGDVCRTEGFEAREALGLAIELCSDFRAGKYNRVGILGTRYISMLSQQPDVRWVLPLTASEQGSDASGMIYEPDELTILEAAVPEYVAGILISTARESFACEIVARRTAMDSAGKNAQEMIDQLQLDYNRARQSAITREITEIVAGSGT
jgi:F-type H+-transporting ATPase subunit gamma